MRVEIVPKSKRAKERVAQHGSVMDLCERQGDKFLVQSLGETWAGMKWQGWFTEQEANYREIKNGKQG